MAKHITLVTNQIESFLENQICEMAKNNSTMAIAKPLLMRYLKNNTGKLHDLLKAFANKDGIIDIEELAEEMFESIMNSKSFKLEAGFLGELEIGDGKIQMDVPLTNMTVALTETDLKKLKGIKKLD